MTVPATKVEEKTALQRSIVQQPLGRGVFQHFLRACCLIKER
jgi:hypothetical protein